MPIAAGVGVIGGGFVGVFVLVLRRFAGVCGESTALVLVPLMLPPSFSVLLDASTESVIVVTSFFDLRPRFLGVSVVGAAMVLCDLTLVERRKLMAANASLSDLPNFRFLKAVNHPVPFLDEWGILTAVARAEWRRSRQDNDSKGVPGSRVVKRK